MSEELMQLISVLQEVEADAETLATLPHTGGRLYHDTDHELVKQALILADKVLITKNGTPDWDAITELKAYGFDVQAGEKDSFGWLTGVITTCKGRLVFG